MKILTKMVKSIGKFVVALAITICLYMALPITYTLDINGGIEGDNMLLRFKVYSFILDLADGNDTVKFNINSPGGLVVPTLDLINHIVDSDAHTISYNRGMAASAAALIAASTDEMRAYPYSVFLYHRPFVIFYGQKALLPLDHYLNLSVTGIMKDRVFKLMTIDQINGYLAGDDIWILSKELLRDKR